MTLGLWGGFGLGFGHQWGCGQLGITRACHGGVGLGGMEMCIVAGCGGELVPSVVLGLTLCLG